MLDRIADGRTDLVFDLVAQGYPAHTLDTSKVSLIQWCAYYGDVSAIRFLLIHGESLSTLGENFDLNGAAFHGHWRLCQYLIEQGADANRPLPDTGESPLHAALCKANRPAYHLVVQVLLAAGADPNAAAKPDVPTGAFMRDARTQAETPLHRAAAFAAPETIELLLNQGANREAQDMHGQTPLAWASWHLRPARILKLLCHGKHTISPQMLERHAADHGCGWGAMDKNLLGNPRL